MEDKMYFLVHRVYSHKERPNDDRRSRVYGWTGSRKVLRAFLKQRDEKKYTFVELTGMEMAEIYSHNDLSRENMITFLLLKSSQTGETFHLFMTLNELNEVEKRVQRIFVDLSMLTRIVTPHSYDLEFDNREDITNKIILFMELYLNIKDKYSDALHFIGYRPSEIEKYYPPPDREEAEIVDDAIDMAYAGNISMEYFNEPHDQIPGLMALEDVSKQILYSLESFIKVMKEDL